MTPSLEQELRALIDEAGKVALEHLPTSLVFDKRDNSQLVPICIYISVVELFHGCMALVAARQWTALPIIVRSMMESYADLRALSTDRGYWKHLHANTVKELLRFAKNVDPNHPFLGSVFEAGDADKRKSELEAELKRAKDANRGPISQQERFQNAQLGAEYESIYWNLCLEGHNNLSALEERHLDYQGSQYQVVAFRQDWPMLNAYLDSMLVTLIGSSQTIHHMFNSGATACFDQIVQRRSEMLAGRLAASTYE